MNRKSILGIALAFSLMLIFLQNISAEIKLPVLISDGMVLQRDIPVKVWGWANPGEQIIISFRDFQDTIQSDDVGNWSVSLPPQSHGGPFTMQISGENEITISNILVGDVWLCSGQSNMEISLKRIEPLYPNEISQSENPEIRYFSTAKKYNFKTAQADLKYGNWQMINPKTAPNISAIAYFYAKELNKKYQIPIGIINSSLGGSPIEAWLSEDALKVFPEPYAEGLKFRSDSFILDIQKSDQARSNKWYHESSKQDMSYSGLSRPWSDPDLDDSSWSTMDVPGYWNETELGEINGVVWFRTEVTISDADAGKHARLNLGRITDADSAFVNGKYVGSTSYLYPPRRYEIPIGLLKAGKNSIVVRVISNNGPGAFVPDKPYEIIIDKQKIDIKGEWNYKVGCEMPQLDSQTFIRWKPMGLYNAMISPLLNYSIKGMLWYQGESNTGNPEAYSELLPAMIKDWREKWDLGDIPFIYVQLPNFMKAEDQPSESNWAEFRQVQLEALKIQNTGMAVTIDLGEWNDIHPLNKEDVGKRLFLIAQKLAYNEKDIVSTGPVFKESEIEGEKIILSFTDVGSGLVSSDEDDLKHFAIAGKDGKFLWANAKIKGDKVVVWNAAVKHPLTVRYAWASNPEGANLYNKEGLPASPFTTAK